MALVTPARSQTPLPGQPVAHPGDPYAGTAGELPLPSWFSPVPDAKTIPGSELDSRCRVDYGDPHNADSRGARAAVSGSLTISCGYCILCIPGSAAFRLRQTL